jgi:hypothetical protein
MHWKTTLPFAVSYTAARTKKIRIALEEKKKEKTLVQEKTKKTSTRRPYTPSPFPYIPDPITLLRMTFISDPENMKTSEK